MREDGPGAWSVRERVCQAPGLSVREDGLSVREDGLSVREDGLSVREASSAGVSMRESGPGAWSVRERGWSVRERGRFSRCIHEGVRSRRLVHESPAATEPSRRHDHDSADGIVTPHNGSWEAG